MSLTQGTLTRATQENIVDLYNLYSAGYGMWPDGTVVHDAFKGIDRRRAFAHAIRSKAVLDSTAAIIHATTDQQVLDFLRQRTPLQELISTETNRGKVVQIDQVSARTAGGPLAETAALPTAQGDTYLSPTQNIIIWVENGGWTDFSQTAFASQYPPRDARALEIRSKLNLMAEEWECEIINGNVSTNTYGSTSYDGANSSLGFPGLREICLNSSQRWSGLLINSKGGNSVTATDINNMLSNGADNNIFYNLAVTDAITFDSLRSIAMSHVRYTDPAGVLPYGIPGIVWVHPETKCNFIVDHWSPSVASNRAITFVDTTKVVQRLLLDTTVELLAKTSIQQNFMIKKFGTLVDKFDAYLNSSRGTRKSSVGMIMGLP